MNELTPRPFALAGAVVLVTGANRGLGAAFATAFLDAGAAKVYAGARDPAAIIDPRLTPVKLDVTNAADVAAAAAQLTDLTLLVNNAGIATGATPLDASFDAARAEFETNVFAPMALSRAFAPVLAANGGGAIVNVLSALSWVSYPQFGWYSASKSAAWSLTNALRTMLDAQDTLVTGLHLGYADTDMTAGVDAPKTAPADIAAALVAGLRAGAVEVLADETSRNVKAALPDDQALLYPGIRAEYGTAVPV